MRPTFLRLSLPYTMCYHYSHCDDVSHAAHCNAYFLLKLPAERRIKNSFNFTYSYRPTEFERIYCLQCTHTVKIINRYAILSDYKNNKRLNNNHYNYLYFGNIINPKPTFCESSYHNKL